MTLCSPRVAWRGLLFGVFFCIAFFVFSGRAHALDATASAETPTQTPATPPPVNESESTPPPNTSAAVPQPSTPAGASGPDDTNNQSATVVTQGTATANSGANTAPTSTSTTVSPSAGGDTTATATSGPASAQGTSATTAITQQASGQASKDATVDILQLALVVNIGSAQATSGGNVAGAGPTPTNSTGSMKTGTASAIGDQAKTGITQSAVITNGDASSQDATVINVGIAVGNTGLNITVGTVGAVAVASTSNTSIASVSSGTARATGDKARSTITQAANGSASGTATLNIDQRAYIVNFGIAIANTGGNFALASLDASSLTPEEQAVVQVLLQALAPLFGTASANGASSVTTGSARAIGNDATTTIAQNVTGVVGGTSAASAVQLAQVANIGFALANTGLNRAGAAPGTELAATQTSLDDFLGLLTNLDWLSSANPSAQFAQTLNLGGLVVDLGGTLSVNDMLLGWDSVIAPDGGPLGAGVHVRQISAVLDIGFATADSGHNVVVAINGSNADATGTDVQLTRGTNKGSERASIVTGNVVAVGNAATVAVCQSFDDATACVAKSVPTPSPHHNPVPATPKPGVMRVATITTRGASTNTRDTTARATAIDPAVAGTLPFTGGNSRSLAELGLALLGLGAVVMRRNRRR